MRFHNAFTHCIACSCKSCLGFINDLLSSTMYFLWWSVLIISSSGRSLSPVRGGVMINLLQLFMAEEEKVKVERLIWKRKAFLETFIYSLTSLSLTLYVVFVSFVHVLNPLLNLSRSGGPRRLWGCSWTSRGPYANIREYIDYSCDLLPVLSFPGASEEMVWMETILESFWYIFPHICLYMKYIDPDINFAFLAWCR